jgi:hypothetical protein
MKQSQTEKKSYDRTIIWGIVQIILQVSTIIHITYVESIKSGRRIEVI